TACTNEDTTEPSSCAAATGPSDTATKTWTAGPPTMLSLAPETSTNTVGSDHTVTATVTDGFGNPVPDATVRFEVDSDGDPTPVSGTDTTDANGQATFTFTNGVAGDDTITACTNSDGSEPTSCETATGPNDSATKTWTTATAPASITLEPSTDVNGVAEDHTVTATVLDADDQPVQGAVVRFEVTGDGSPDPADGTAVTDADGTATFTFTNDTPGQNTITACTTADGSDPGSCGTADPQLTATATKTWEQRAATVILEPDADANAVGTAHTVTATVLDGAGQPMEDVHVRFDVFRDPPEGSAPTGTDRTDSNGQATFTYTGPTEPADDVIWACVREGATATTLRPSHCTVDDAGQQAREGFITDTANKAWEVPAPQTLTVTPASDTNTIGTPHTVTATVRDQFGNPFEGANVLFEVTGDPAPDPDSGSDTTDANGEATFTFTNPLPGQNTITACTNSDGSLPASCGAATGPSGTATKTWTVT
ncbi:MAG: Ig-like domain-containing protein, partial [Actinobacteria bacterium]|nr:Ig-like domain-containing protein [Actinomycetota bacterium]